MFTFIEPFYFFIALCVGLFFVYILTPTPDIIIKYPIPDNEALIYQDFADNCYKYIAEEIDCPTDKSSIKKFDIQHIKRNNLI